MILYYLKVASRNLLAHKTQTFVSIFALAISFACVSLATYWSRYERTYDAFQDNADRIYRIQLKSFGQVSESSLKTPYPLHLYLKDVYPEIESSCVIQNVVNSGQGALLWKWNGFKVSVEGVVYSMEVFPKRITSNVLDIFDFEWIEGDKNVMAYGNSKIAISEQLASKVCGDGSPLGKTMVLHDRGLEFEIAGVYKTRSMHSNLKFDIIMPLQPNDKWNTFLGHTYIMLEPGVNDGCFIQKLQTDTIGVMTLPTYCIATPLTTMRHICPDEEMNVSLEDVVLFTYAAALLALCALLNYLTLFVSRLRSRGRDMALRAICGSSSWQMSSLLFTEYLLLLLVASLVGVLLVEFVIHKFMELAMIEISGFSVMISCACLMLFSVVLSALLSTVPILYFRRKVLRVQMEATSVRLGKNYFRLMAVCVQLVIGFLFIFCSTVMMKQVYMLTNIDNIDRKQVAWVRSDEKIADLMQAVLQQQPIVKDVIVVDPLYPVRPQLLQNIFQWDGRSSDDSDIRCERYGIDNETAQFYDLKMKEGASTFDLGEKEVFVNETLAKRLNIGNPVGKTLNFGNKIKGVIYDYQIQNPNTSPNPVLYVPSKPSQRYVAFKYDGDWKNCEKILMEAFQKKGVENISFADGEEFYQQYIKSEYNLLKLLGVITVVSILIAIFGIYALIMQSCDQHRKEIAIRKVHGAGVMDILMMFFKQYMVQVVVAAAIAFPIGYVLMKNWLEQYARQTSISLWIYLCIFLGISLLVTLCIGWRVWKAANENPAWVIKKE